MSQGLSRVVLFADMLGFASLTEGHSIEKKEIMRAEKPLSWIDNGFPDYSPNQLTKAFVDFHKTVKWAVNLVQMRCSATAVTFSDSVFVATPYLYQAVEVACYLTGSLIKAGIPLRAGIAFGTFEAIRFRSDVSADEGDHAAQFLGTGVVWSSRAERCGIKGCRILLHPSVERLLHDSNHAPNRTNDAFRYIECSSKEQNNSVGVRFEIDYWNFRKLSERQAWRSFQKMWDASPEKHEIHYAATAAAIDRMRVAQGEKPLDSLRRRTMPRRLTQ